MQVTYLLNILITYGIFGAAKMRIPEQCFEQADEMVGLKAAYYQANLLSDIDILTGEDYKAGMKLDSIYFCRD